MYPILRALVAVVGVLCLMGGLAVISGGGRAAPSGLWLIVLGAAALIAVAFERTRYRSESAERDGGASGSAGIDDGPLDPGFRATEERFVDPTTRQRLRVWVNPASGERRYRRDE
jgi:hypothetical protein